VRNIPARRENILRAGKRTEGRVHHVEREAGLVGGDPVHPPTLEEALGGPVVEMTDGGNIIAVIDHKPVRRIVNRRPVISRGLIEGISGAKAAQPAKSPASKRRIFKS